MVTSFLESIANSDSIGKRRSKRKRRGFDRKEELFKMLHFFDAFFLVSLFFLEQKPYKIGSKLLYNFSYELLKPF